MRKLWIFAAFAALALTSCQQEKDIRGAAATKGIAFNLQGAKTRAAQPAVSEEAGLSIPIGETGGYTLYLEETIVDLNGATSATRGTPVYTENVGYLYKNKLGVYTDAAGGVDASYTRLSDEPTPDGWIYEHEYTQNIWPDETTDVQFYLRMPTDMTDHGVSSLASENGKTTLSYVSPETAKQQQDIIFGGVLMNHKTYQGYRTSKGGVPVTMYHALTGVKFAIKNTAADLAKFQVNKISFLGLKNKGTMTFTSPETITWSGLEVGTTEATVGEGDEAGTVQVPNAIYQTFQTGDLVTFDSETHAGNHFADSFFGAGTSQNLNKADASYTFWLIPQKFTDFDAVLRIEYTVDGKNQSMDISIKDDLNAPDWKAGQIRTYTFKIDEVNVKIDDAVSISGTATDGYSGSKKTGVTITNTGNCKAFIRAAIVGQWLDSDNNPVFGFTDEINKLYVVESWYEDQFVNKERKHGTFVGLPGYSKTGGDNPLNGWQLCEDGYYYYTSVVAPGAATGSALFTSYETAIVPAAAIAGNEMDAEEMHFQLEIATQAISAVKRDGTEYTWTEAWYRALGETPVIKSAN